MGQHWGTRHGVRSGRWQVLQGSPGVLVPLSVGLSPVLTSAFLCSAFPSVSSAIAALQQLKIENHRPRVRSLSLCPQTRAHTYTNCHGSLPPPPGNVVLTGQLGIFPPVPGSLPLGPLHPPKEGEALCRRGPLAFPLREGCFAWSNPFLGL